MGDMRIPYTGPLILNYHTMNNHEQALFWGTCEKCKDCIYVGGYCWMAWDPDHTDALVFCLSCWAKFPMCWLRQPNSRLAPRIGARGPGTVCASLITCVD